MTCLCNISKINNIVEVALFCEEIQPKIIKTIILSVLMFINQTQTTQNPGCKTFVELVWKKSPTLSPHFSFHWNLVGELLCPVSSEPSGATIGLDAEEVGGGSGGKASWSGELLSKNYTKIRIWWFSNWSKTRCASAEQNRKCNTLRIYLFKTASWSSVVFLSTNITLILRIMWVLSN